jgi:hypothetical protein
LWADLLQTIVKRAETRLHTPSLIKFMEIENTDKKLHEFSKMFDLSKRLDTYVKDHVRESLINIPWDYENPRRSRF